MLLGIHGTSKSELHEFASPLIVIFRPVVLLHVPLPGLGRGRVEYLSTAQIFYSPFAQPRQQDMKENYRSGELHRKEISTGLVMGRGEPCEI